MHRYANRFKKIFIKKTTFFENNLRLLNLALFFIKELI